MSKGGIKFITNTPMVTEELSFTKINNQHKPGPAGPNKELLIDVGCPLAQAGAPQAFHLFKFRHTSDSGNSSPQHTEPKIARWGK